MGFGTRKELIAEVGRLVMYNIGEMPVHIITTYSETD